MNLSKNRRRNNFENSPVNIPNNDPKQEPIIIFLLVDPKEFIEQRNKLHLDLQCYLTLYKPDEYLKKNTKLYLSEDRQCGFSIDPDGQLISVFSLERARGSAIVKESIVRGAKHLSCLGEKLKKLYGAVGFMVVRQLPWDDKYAPPGWNKKRFGEPYCYEMKKEEST
jgi:hypothetical protein